MTCLEMFENGINLHHKHNVGIMTYLDMFENRIKSHHRDVSAGATGATGVAPKFSDTLTLFQPGGADSAHHWRG